MARLIRELSADYKVHSESLAFPNSFTLFPLDRWQSLAIEAVRVAAEEYLIGLLKDDMTTRLQALFALKIAAERGSLFEYCSCTTRNKLK